ncbi:hypothetical protein M947_10480 [Sulfurimonas hongkongensis]|uniref:UPF0323 domain-containing protein n=1 Tax=Sulfurimonas hongkongensis TaxID=1172190 RepID=T0KD19_9BACT|nr:hypothetical protein [Sulfurimonas hongkongensis]EQB34614.1 hypothetical protein M947_10480 [Sulfurimonas hongkongensis]
MKHISSLAGGVALGSAGVIMMSVLSGCGTQQQEQQNRFLVIEQQANGKYIVTEEMPTEGPNRAIIREKDAHGNTIERFMNEEEMKALAEQEYQKVQDGTSETVQSGDSSAGMGLAGTILAVAAGSLLGNMIGNALMNNKNFAKNSASTNKSAYSRSAASKASKSSSSKRSFFGGSNSRTASKSSRSYGG